MMRVNNLQKQTEEEQALKEATI